MREVYKYTFQSGTAPEDVEIDLLLAIFSVESLHGEAQARLDASHAFDPKGLSLVVDAGTTVGRDLNRLVCGYLRRDLGEDGFSVERLQSEATHKLEAAA